jgi:mRNA interferase MazF
MKHFEIWMANLDPQRGTEVGKTRPVLIVQSNLLNDLILSTIVCPITTRKTSSVITKVAIDSSQETGLDKPSWVVLDQIRSIDDRRFMRKLGELPSNLVSTINKNLKVILELE